MASVIKVYVLFCAALAVACFALAPNGFGFDFQNQDNLRVVLLGGGLFSIAIAVLIRE